MIPRAIGKLTGWYMASWVFLTWSVVCVGAGAAVMNVADRQATLAAIHQWAAHQ